MVENNQRLGADSASPINSSPRAIPRLTDEERQHFRSRLSNRWLFIRTNNSNAGGSSVASVTRRIGRLMLLSRNAHQRHIRESEELRERCYHLEQELENTKLQISQLRGIVQLVANETDRSNRNNREMVRCFDTWGRDRLSHDNIRDLRRLRGMVHDIVTSVDLNGPERIGNIDDDLSDAGSD